MQNLHIRSPLAETVQADSYVTFVKYSKFIKLVLHFVYQRRFGLNGYVLQSNTTSILKEITTQIVLNRDFFQINDMMAVIILPPLFLQANQKFLDYVLFLSKMIPVASVNQFLFFFLTTMGSFLSLHFENHTFSRFKKRLHTKAADSY